MGYRFLANAVALFHGLVIVPIYVGGPIWMYLSAQPPIWVTVSFALIIVLALLSFLVWRACFLTAWEQQLRHRAGQTSYQGGFIQHYAAQLGIRLSDFLVLILSASLFVAGCGRLFFLWKI